MRTTYTHWNDPVYLHNRAVELRSLADYLNTPDARRRLLKCAEEYDQLAKKAEEIMDEHLARGT